MRATRDNGAGRVGRQRVVWLAAIVTILLCLPLALIAAATVGDGAFLTVLVAGVVLLVGGIGYGLVRAGLSRRQLESVPVGAPPNADLRLVASRLISVEKRVAEISGPSGADGAVTEMASDLGLLSSLVKGLAETLAQQERELSDLRDRVDLLARRTAQASALRSAGNDAPRAPKPEGENQVAHPAQHQRPPRLFPTAFPDGARETKRFDPADLGSRHGEIEAAARANLVEIHLEPVVSLPQRHTQGYQLLPRLRLADGTLVEPTEFVPVLDRADQLAQLDAVVLSRALAVAAELEPASRDLRLACEMFSRVDRSTRVEGVIGPLLDQFPAGVRRATLQLSAANWRSLPATSLRHLSRAKDAGLSFCMGGLDGWTLDEALALPLRPDFIKVSCDLILNTPHDHVAASLRRAREGGIRIVAERVASERDILDLLDFDIPLAQGAAFGAPRPLHADGTQPASAPAPIPSARAEAPMRLRDVVRRVG